MVAMLGRGGSKGGGDGVEVEVEVRVLECV